MFVFLRNCKICRFSSDEFGFDGSRRRNVNDMLGNVAIRAEPLTSANDPGAKPVPSHQESEAKTQ
ncbi:unnamed protein product, partial [Nesidiocoris tenuis]